METFTTAEKARELMVDARRADFLPKAYELIREEARNGKASCYLDIVPTIDEIDTLYSRGFDVSLRQDMGDVVGVNISWVYNRLEFKTNEK